MAAKKSKEEKAMSKTDISLIVVLVILVAFVLKMIQLYEVTGGIPEVLCGGVLALLGFECGCLGKIYEVKKKYKEREWEKEDARAAEKKAKAEDAKARRVKKE